MSDDEFENQLQQEAEEKERNEQLKAGKVKVDPDGTVYEWDEDKKAWFPKVDADFIARYQMSYGADVSSEKPSGESTNNPPSPSDPGYAEWYFSNYGDSVDTTTKEYREWYEYYYGNQAESTEQVQTVEGDNKSLKTKDTTNDNDTSDEPPEKKVRVEGDGEGSESTEGAEQSYRDYYNAYYQQHGQTEGQTQGQEGEEGKEEAVKLDLSHPDYWNQYYSMQAVDTNTEPSVAEGQQEEPEAGDKAEAGKKGKKKKGAPKPVVPPSWFEIDETKNTSVYVTGLPLEYTEEKFVTLMNKCGLIMYDPRTRKPKVKLYKDKDGKIKGDGRCCYIKRESVDLALQFLDGSDVDGYKINVEVAKFELKGQYDPSKKKKKLTNSEKKKFKEKQEKLFDWRPDKPRGTRNKFERVVIIKNFFHPDDFNTNPALINELRQEIREECTKFGEVKKVTLYDRHPDGVVSVSFKEAEEADACVQALNRRYFAGKRLLVETWDGKSKYEVEETEEQRTERLSKWEKYLEGESKTGAGQESSDTAADSKQVGQSGEQGGSMMETQPEVSEGGAVQAVEPEDDEGSGASS